MERALNEANPVDGLDSAKAGRWGSQPLISEVDLSHTVVGPANKVSFECHMVSCGS